jgi:hypothetical protein
VCVYEVDDNCATTIRSLRAAAPMAISLTTTTRFDDDRARLTSEYWNKNSPSLIVHLSPRQEQKKNQTR